MPSETPTLELEAYLRLNNASSEEWLAALRSLSGCRNIECRINGSHPIVGALSALTCDYGHVVCLSANQALEISGYYSEAVGMLLAVRGEVEVARDSGEPWGPLTQLMLVRPVDRVRLRLAPGSQVVVLQPLPGHSPDAASGTSIWPVATMRRLVENYLGRARFFGDDQSARRLTSRLFHDLANAAGAGAALETPTPPHLDRRLVRVLEKIQQEPQWEFDLRELASHSGVSERNLYYLMKRETGMTPYRFFQRSRLLRVRRRLVDCRCEVPHISWYAADEGFSHLGRFAALYRQHFGELPSQTVQWRRSLLTGSRWVEKRPAII